VGDQAETLSLQYGRVLAFLRRRTGDPDRAAELTQEVFLGAARALANGRTPEDALLFRIAQRRFVDHVRRLSRQPESVSIDSVPELAAPTRYPTAVARALRRSLGRLSDQQQEILVLKLFEGRSFAEIAARLGANEPACRTRFRRALIALRSELVQEGVGDADI
jgi:RNA polymerase sigma-70 factor (ECF subfamily)